ncbi:MULTISPECIES: alpha/beta hydrolase [Streptomyces]|uniref:Esterase n=1 Tax=Streptomyces morookaense TaxID=1970 RepID=A0A7Y7B1E6_STRMO|nr:MULTISPECIES: alpha/beta hydrolase-fold protein [Streptomyces]MCC2275099.1 esterase family protein [Streptomyces sp. ET3-23]NVK76871.1 esterase [Streptomyces morookaense]GHF25937.1 esterase [Streptomyces morookaense]
MGLTSRSLFYTVTFGAVLCVALMVWVWPRLAGRGVLPVLGRLGSILTTQLAIMAALLLAVNSWGQFYGTWGQLLGRVDKAPVNVNEMTQGAPYATVGASKDGLVQPAGPQGIDKVGGIPRGPAEKEGKVQSVRIIGQKSRAINPAFIYLPPQYFQKQYERHRFPVMVVISGYPGGIMNLAQHLQVPQTAGSLLAQNKMQPTIIVMVRPTIAPPRDTECVDVPDGPQAETFFAEDLPDALKSTYRVGGDPSAWGVLGYSSGGTCALELAMRRPNVYPAAAALSGDYKVGSDPTTGKLFGSGPDAKQRQREHDLIWRLENMPVPRVSVLVTSSKKGEKNYGETEKFLKAVKQPMTASSVILPEGSHNFQTWRREIGPVLEWMSQQLTFPQDTADKPKS